MKKKRLHNRIVMRSSKEYRNHFHLLNVHERLTELIRSGIYSRAHDYILLGSENKDINTNGITDITESRLYLQNVCVPDQFKFKNHLK